MNCQHSEAQQRLLAEHKTLKHQLQKEYDERLKLEVERLQRSHRDSLEILREENDSIREQIDENKMIIEDLKKKKKESDDMVKAYHNREASFLQQLDAASSEISMLKEENSKLLPYCDDPNKSVQVMCCFVYVTLLL